MSQSSSPHPSGLKRPQKFYMPPDYDFSNKNAKSWKDYWPFFRLRTDAVWQKYKLKDWFRSHYKTFSFNKLNHCYQTVDPQQDYIFLRQPQAIQEQDITPFQGYNATGATTSFQYLSGQRDPQQTSYQLYYSMSDYYLMCSLRFDKWAKCQSQIQGLPLTQKYKNYPCYQQFYEVNSACADNMIQHLLQLQYVKQANGLTGEQYHNAQLLRSPNIYDSPNKQQRRPYGY